MSIYKIVFLIIFSITSNYAHSFDLKKLGDSLNKELGGKLKELEKELNKNVSPNNETQNNQNKSSSQDKVKKKDNNDCISTQGVHATELKKDCIPNFVNKKYLPLEYMYKARGSAEYYSAQCIYKTKVLNRNERIEGAPENIDKKCGQYVSKWKKEEADWIALKKKNAKIKAAKKKREEDNKKQIIASAKNRESRGKWGVRFNMLHKDLVANGFKKVSDTAYMNDKDYTFVKTNRKGFPYKIYRSMEQYSASGFADYTESLSKYKLLIKPTTTEREKFITGKGNLNYYYKNEKNDTNPMYIELFTFKTGRVNMIGVGYLAKDYFEEVVMKSKNKRKKSLKDL